MKDNGLPPKGQGEGTFLSSSLFISSPARVSLSGFCRESMGVSFYYPSLTLPILHTHISTTIPSAYKSRPSGPAQIPWTTPTLGQEG